MKKTSKNTHIWPHFESKHPRAHLHPHLLPCNKLHALEFENLQNRICN